MISSPIGNSDATRDVRLPPLPIVEYEGWQSFVSQVRPTRPTPPSQEMWLAMSEGDKKKSRETRIRWHNKMPPIRTTRVNEIFKIGLELFSENYYAKPGARRGLALEGLADVGKSTLLVELGRIYEIELRRQFNLGPRENMDETSTFLPAAYITLPGNVTPNSFDKQLLSFYGAPDPPVRATEADLMKQVVNFIVRCGTSVVFVDDVHFLDMRYLPAQLANNHIKSLASKAPATFVYAGIDLERTGLFTEGEAVTHRDHSQTDHRFICCTIEPYEKSDPELKKTLAQYEKNISLVLHEERDLTSLRPYIHERTRGFMGSIDHLIRASANLAIKSGEERLSKGLMERVRLDHASESLRVPKKND